MLKLLTLATYALAAQTKENSRPPLIFAIEVGETKQSSHVTHIGSLLQESVSSQQKDKESDTKGEPFETDLTDFFDVQIYANLYFGDKSTPQKVIFDTGSSWLWVQTHLCQSCPNQGQHYDFTKSSTFEQVQSLRSQDKQVGNEKLKKLEIINVYYGTGQIDGFLANEQVCLDTNMQKCVDSMPIIAMFAQTGLSGLMASGIIGMSPSSSRENAILFVEQLYRDGQIEENLFAFSIGREKEQSTVQIGGFDLQQHSDGDLIWHDLLDTKYWLLPMNNCTFAGEQIKTKARTAIVDTGTSLLLLPTEDFAQVLQIFQKKYDLAFRLTHTGYYSASCEPSQLDQISSISFEIDNIRYELPREALVEYLPLYQSCKLKLMTLSGMKTSWVLGLNFFHSYYTVFDAGNKRVGFARSKFVQGNQVIQLSGQSAAYDTSFREKLFGQSNSYDGNSAALVIVIIITCVIICVCTVKLCRKNQVNDDVELNPSETTLMQSNSSYQVLKSTNEFKPVKSDLSRTSSTVSKSGKKKPEWAALMTQGSEDSGDKSPYTKPIGRETLA